MAAAENYTSIIFPYIKSYILWLWHYSLPKIPVSIRNDFIPFWNRFKPFRNEFILVQVFS